MNLLPRGTARQARRTSLLLHYGEPDDPKLIVIDGGPGGVFKDALLPRLEALRTERGGELTIENLMVSHVDQDHVRGVLDFARALDEDDALRVRLQGQDAMAGLLRGHGRRRLPIAAEAMRGPGGARGGRTRGEIASVGEGRGLRDLARQTRLAHQQRLRRAGDGPGRRRGGDRPRSTPSHRRRSPRRRARGATQRMGERGRETGEKGEIGGRGLEYLDESVYNLSSIVCLAELGGSKRMLLTGDARGDKTSSASNGGIVVERQTARGRHPEDAATTAAAATWSPILRAESRRPRRWSSPPTAKTKIQTCQLWK